MNSQQTQRNPRKDGVSIPLPMRVGGAFMALGITLFIMGVVAMISDGVNVPFEMTWPRLAILVAALIVGAFATIRTDQKSSKAQVGALVVAVALIIASRFLPPTVLTVLGQFWLFMYGAAALLCALIIRRAMIPKS